MSIAWPITEVIPPQFEAQMSYTGKKFRDFCIWRDNKAIHSDGRILRLSSQVVFVILLVMAYCELFIRAIKSEDRLTFPTIHSYRTAQLASRALYYNHREKNISSKLKGELDIAEMCYNFFPFGSFEKRFVETKLLSLWLELDHKTETSEGKFVEKQGLPYGVNFFTFQSIANSIKAFSQSKDFALLSMKKEKVLHLANAFSSHHSFILDPNNAKKIQNKELCFLQCNWGNHSVCLAFFGGYMAIGNRGEGSDKIGTTLTVFKIDPELMTEKVIEEIGKDRTKEEGMKYFYQTLPAQLTKNGVACQDALCDRFQHIQPHYQTIGNCPLASAQSVLRFAWAMLLDPMPDAEILDKAEMETLFFEKYAGIRYMDLIHPLPEQFQNSQPLFSRTRIHAEKTYKTIANHLHNTVRGKQSFFDKFLFKKWVKYIQIESSMNRWIADWSTHPLMVKLFVVWQMSPSLHPKPKLFF